MNFMDIFYVALWAIMAVYCYWSAHKVHNILYLAGVFFTFLFGWNLAELIMQIDLQQGVADWVFKGIALAFLIAFGVFYIILRKNNKDK